jgi:hypothetical protein
MICKHARYALVQNLVVHKLNFQHRQILMGETGCIYLMTERTIAFFHEKSTRNNQKDVILSKKN